MRNGVVRRGMLGIEEGMDWWCGVAVEVQWCGVEQLCGGLL